jgi:hypothetical protein
MRLDTPRARLDLAKNELATLRQACRTRLDVLEGTAWVTIDNDPRDVVLTRGQSFLVESGNDVIVYAIDDGAVVDVQPPGRPVRCQPQAARRPSWPAWLRGVYSSAAA